MMLLKRLFFAFFLTGFLAACSGVNQQHIGLDLVDQNQNQNQAHRGSQKNWWYARFRIHWPEENKQPQWHIDTLLAHQVVRPVLNKYRKDIKLWRFHRRAGHNGGHIFSFIFYSRPEIAEEVYRKLAKSHVLSDLITDNVVEKLITEELTTLSRPNIEDTSDKHWNVVIQKSWPYYIMGISEMWLDMIDLLVSFNKDREEESLQIFFKNIDDAISQLWKNEGGHAYLHHLNALFAYKPVAITEQRLKNF